MKLINKINLVENTVENIALFDSALTRKFDEMGLEPINAMCKICAETPKNKETEAIVRATLTNMVSSGFMFNGDINTPFMSGASDGRKATSTWINQDILPGMGKWAMCGLVSKKMELAINKYMSYTGLLSSASKPFDKAFSKKIDIHRVAIIKDVDVVVDAIVDYVSAKDGIEKEKIRQLVINAFDGFGIIRKELTNGESVTIRAPWMKAFVQALDFKKIYAWCVQNGIKAEFVDRWGTTWKLKDVDMILTESCFKTAKLYETWDQYCSAFEELKHEVCVCVREHAPKLKGLPYQQGQTLMGTEDDATSFMMHAKKTVYKYREPKNAAKLLHGWQRIAAKIYPTLMNEPETYRTIQEAFTTKRNDMLGGRIPELGYNAFIAPDPVAFLQHLFGLPITGYLKAGECFCAAAKPGIVDVTRNPHLDNAHVLLNNVDSCPLAEGPTMFINIFDTTTIQLRCDYDGDHVWYSQDEHLLELVKRTYSELKNIPIDWDAPKAPKSPVNKKTIGEFIINLIHGSEIGLYADALTKMWNTKYDREVCDWLTWAGNVLIDAAKHGSIKIEKPEAVDALSEVSLPLFAMYAKANEKRPIGPFWTDERYTCSKFRGVVYKSEYNPEKHGEIKEIRPPRCAYSGSFLDMYSKKIKENIPETLEIEGLDDQIFDFTLMMIDMHRKVGNFVGLSKKGVYDPETNTFKECGLFQDIAFRHSSQWNELIGNASFFANRQEWEEETGRAARKEILDWAYAQYPDIKRSPSMDERIDDACYDIILRNIFTSKMSEGMDKVIKQAFWRIYGDKAVENLKSRLHPDLSDEELFNLPDIDCDDVEELVNPDED